jgi:hypothetical protein
MTAQTRTVLKALFEDGDKPQGSNYSDWIDSMVSIADTTAQTVASDLVAPKFIATTEVSAPIINASVATINSLTVTEVVSASSAVIETASIGAITNKVKFGPTGEQGDAVLSQRATLTNAATAATTVAVMASGSDVLDAYFFVTTAFGSAAADVEVRLGDVDNETKYGTFSMDTNIATGMHHLSNGAFTSAGTSWMDISGSAKTVLAKVTAVSGALASGASGVLNIVYVSK